MLEPEPEVERVFADGEAPLVGGQGHPRKILGKRLERAGRPVPQRVEPVAILGTKVFRRLMDQRASPADHAQPRLGKDPRAILQRRLGLFQKAGDGLQAACGSASAVLG